MVCGGSQDFSIANDWVENSSAGGDIKNGKPSVHLRSAPEERLLQRGSPDLLMHRVWFAAEVISDINQDKEIYSVIYSWYVVDFGMILVP